MRQVFRAVAFIVITAISFSVITASVPQIAHAVDQLMWYSTDYALVGGETISGTKRVILVSDTRWSQRYVTKWCIYLDGRAITYPSYALGFEAPQTLAVNIFYIDGTTSRGADETSSGCWTTTLADRPYGFSVTLNTTTWSNSSHAVRIEATISDSSIISKTTTVTSSNTDPKVEWITASPLTAASTMTLTAKITPQVNRITKACLTRDGTAIPKSEQTSFVGDTRYDYGGGGPTGTFGSSKGGCVSFDSYQNSSAPPGLWQVTTLTISLKTSTWAAIPAALKLTITEAIGREFSTSISFNPAASPTSSASSPTLSGATTTSSGEPLSDIVSWKFTGVSEGQIISGWSDIEPLNAYSFTASGSIGVCITGIGAERSCNSNYAVNTSCYENGPQVITATASGKYGAGLESDWEESRRYNVSIVNTSPSLDSVKATNTKPSWKNSTTSGSITLNSQFGCNYSITLKSSSSKAKTLTGSLAADSTKVSFSGLTPKTKYIAVASVISKNGTQKKTFTFTTPAIPAKPRPTSSGGSSGGSSSGSSYPKVIGWQLDRAMSASSAFYYKQYSSCYRFSGFENGGFGVLDKSNWAVVDQSGSLLYVCKRK